MLAEAPHLDSATSYLCTPYSAPPQHCSARVAKSFVSRLSLSLLVVLMSQEAEAVHPTPAGLTELSTIVGSQLLQNSLPSDGFWNLTQEFTTQDSQDWCGLASATMVLNALPVPKPSVRAFDG